MNCSYSTHCTSRFISSTIDPLSKFKQLQKQKFMDMYDKISEQPFVQPIQCVDQTIELSIQPSLSSFKSIDSKHSIQLKQQSIQFSYKAQKLEEVQASQYSIKKYKRKRIFDSLNIELVNHTQLLQFQNFAQSNISTERKRLVSEQIQTSFVSQINQKGEISINNQSIQSLFKNKDGNNLLEYLEDNYNYTKWQNHDNWKPNISETKFRLLEEDYKYSYCEKCKNILKDQNISIHSNYCGINECKGYKEMLLKFKYLIVQESNQLRDYNIQCQQSRICCFAGLEILEQLIQCKQERRITKLKQDLQQINEYIQRLQNQYTEQVCQIFNHLISRI